MSLKSRLISLIMTAIILVSLLVVGVFAATKHDIKMGGNVKFSADGVVAKVELVSLDNGNLTNGIIGIDRLQTVELDNQTSKQDFEDAVDTWADLELEFAKRDGTPMTMQIKVTKKYHIITVRITIIRKSLKIRSIGENVGKRGPVSCSVQFSSVAQSCPTLQSH